LNISIDKVGWIGTGVMGAAICRHLKRADYSLYIHSRTRSKAEPLINEGANWCESPQAIAEQCNVIFTMVGAPDEVRDVYFGDKGIFSGLRADSVVVDMGTTPPGLTLEIAQKAKQLPAHTVDAPVSGGDIGASNGTLSIMAAGDPSVVASLQPLFDCMAKSVSYMGGAGNGQHTKLCNQLAVAGTMIGVCEALLYSSKAGVDCSALIEAIKPGAAGCWTLDNLAPRIIKQDFAPGFMVDHFIKDLGIAVNEADNLGLELPGLQLAHRLYIETRAMGHGKSGTQALIHAIEKLSTQ